MRSEWKCCKAGVCVWVLSQSVAMYLEKLRQLDEEAKQICFGFRAADDAAAVAVDANQRQTKSIQSVSVRASDRETTSAYDWLIASLPLSSGGSQLKLANYISVSFDPLSFHD